MGSHGKLASQRDLARYSGASGALPLTARAVVIIISPVWTIWKGYFHLLKGLWACFLLALMKKKKKKDGGGGGGKVTVEIWLKGRFNLQTFQVFQEIFYDIICILIYSLHTIYVPVVP